MQLDLTWQELFVVNHGCLCNMGFVPGPFYISIFLWLALQHGEGGHLCTGNCQNHPSFFLWGHAALLAFLSVLLQLPK